VQRAAHLQVVADGVPDDDAAGEHLRRLPLDHLERLGGSEVHWPDAAAAPSRAVSSQGVMASLLCDDLPGTVCGQCCVQYACDQREVTSKQAHTQATQLHHF